MGEVTRSAEFRYSGPDSVLEVIRVDRYRDGDQLKPEYTVYEIVETTNDGHIETSICNSINIDRGKRLLTWLQRIKADA